MKENQPLLKGKSSLADPNSTLMVIFTMERYEILKPQRFATILSLILIQAC